MTTITEDYVSFETAKLLKEKGFGIKEETRGYYPIKGDATGRIMFGAEYHHNTSQVQIAAPTLQMACKWLREKHHVYFETFPRFTEEGSIEWSTRIYNTDRCVAFLDKYSKHYTGNSYEQATEAAIKYCLENLI